MRDSVASGTRCAVARGAAVVAPGWARTSVTVVAEVTVVARAILPVVRGYYDWDLCSSLALWGRAT
jgi:hypothetical protein